MPYLQALPCKARLFFGRNISAWEFVMRQCQACERLLPMQKGPGRPRSFCVACSPRDAVAATRAWRRRNREAILARRRAAYKAQAEGVRDESKASDE